MGNKFEESNNDDFYNKTNEANENIFPDSGHFTWVRLSPGVSQHRSGWHGTGAGAGGGRRKQEMTARCHSHITGDRHKFNTHPSFVTTLSSAPAAG